MTEQVKRFDMFFGQAQNSVKNYPATIPAVQSMESKEGKWVLFTDHEKWKEQARQEFHKKVGTDKYDDYLIWLNRIIDEVLK